LTRTVDPTITEAYNLYQNVDGWQRDYIYYGISEGNTTGPMSYDFSETIGSFSMSDAQGGYNTIADQTGDATINETLDSSNWSHWTDGQFDFEAKVVINSTGGAGTETSKKFAVRPDDLFDLTYQRHSRRFLFWTRTWYTLSSIQSKSVLVNKNVVTWNVKDKSVEFKISFYEVDNPETISATETYTSKFATNFELHGSYGTDVKVGMKFGMSSEVTMSSSITKSTTLTTDVLGEQIINFGDKVILGRLTNPFLGSRWRIRDYDTGSVKFTFEPRRVQ
jgi:hypothetical protein